jgi:S-adenosylmethionine hydroxide adenosyltransferase-like protein
MHVLVHMVADYGLGDLAFAEVAQRLMQHLPDAQLVFTLVPAFDTLSAGFCVAQLALTEGPTDRIVYCNVAPREDENDPRPDNEGERLVAGRTPTGVLVVAPNSRYTFSFLRPATTPLHEVQVPKSSSQFRSRDVFPQLVAALARGDDTALGPELTDEAIPPPPERVVAYIDGYGNLKTTWSQPPASSGTRVRVQIGDRSVEATVSDGTFEVPAGETSFAPGSSGWRTSDGDLAWYELFARGASAAALLGHPAAGAEVNVTLR